MAPFSFSFSVSFGAGDPLFLGNGLRQDQNQDTDESFVPHTFVIGAFLAIFVAQVGLNLIHGVRSGRFRREILRREALRVNGANGVEQDEQPETVERVQTEGGAFETNEADHGQPGTGEDVRNEALGDGDTGHEQPGVEESVQNEVAGDREHSRDPE